MRKLSILFILTFLMMVFFQDELLAQQFFGKISAISDRALNKIFKVGEKSEGIVIEKQGGTFQRGVVIDTLLYIGDRVVTDSFTSLEISVGTDHTIAIKEKTEFECKENAIKISKGFLFLSKMVSSMRSRFRVETAHVQILSKGTKFTVEAESEDKASITVLEGIVEILDENGNILVEIENGSRRIVENGALSKETQIDTKTEMEQINNWITSFRVRETSQIKESSNIMLFGLNEALSQSSISSISEAKELTAKRFLIKDKEERLKLVEQARRDGFKIFDITNYEGARKAGDTYLQMSKERTVRLDAKSDLDQAVNLYEKAFSLASSDLEKAELHNSLGVCYIELAWEESEPSIKDELFRKARSVLELAVKESDNLAEAYSNLGIVYNFIKLPGKSAEANQKAHDINVKLAEPWNNQGTALLDGEKYAEAMDKLREAVKLDSENSTTFFNLGLCFYYLKQYDDAIVNYLKAIEFKPDDADAYYDLGIAYYNKKDYDKAIESYMKAIELKPDYAEAYIVLGLAYIGKDDYDKAIESYMKAIELKPDYAEAYIVLGLAYIDKD